MNAIIYYLCNVPPPSQPFLSSTCHCGEGASESSPPWRMGVREEEGRKERERPKNARGVAHSIGRPGRGARDPRLVAVAQVVVVDDEATFRPRCPNDPFRSSAGRAEVKRQCGTHSAPPPQGRSLEEEEEEEEEEVVSDGAGKLNMNFGASGLPTLKTGGGILCLPARGDCDRARGAFRDERRRLPAMTAEFSTTGEGGLGRLEQRNGTGNTTTSLTRMSSCQPWRSLCGQLRGNWRYAPDYRRGEEMWRRGGRKMELRNP